MEIEITKELLFVQYWGQKVLKYKGDDNLYEVNSETIKDINNCYLELKDVSHWIASRKKVVLENSLSSGSKVIDGLIEANYYSTDSADRQIILRLQGYAVPMIVAVEDFIKFGWIEVL